MLWGALFLLVAGVLPAQAQECDADAGTFRSSRICLLPNGQVRLIAEPAGDVESPPEFRVLYVLTTGDSLIVRQVSNSPDFTVENPSGLYTIHTLVYNPATLDLSVVVPGTTTGAQVFALLQEGGGQICGSLDVSGAQFRFGCDEVCIADAGSLVPANGDDTCLRDSQAVLRAEFDDFPVVPAGFRLLYVLTSGDSLIIQAVSDSAVFTVDTTGRFTIHTLVYDTATLDLGIVEIGVTSGADVSVLLASGGGQICGALDVEGAVFNIEPCEDCDASAGSLTATDPGCLSDSTLTLRAEVDEAPVVPDGFSVLYVLTSGDSLVIRAVSDSAVFTVDTIGTFTIHTLVYDSTTLDLSIVRIDTTTGFDVNGLLIQGGGEICAALDVEGARFEVEPCSDCEVSAGRLTARDSVCLDGGLAKLRASVDEAPEVPAGFEVVYVLTTGDSLIILNTASTPEFEVDTTGIFTIHTLVYNPDSLDLGIITPGATSGFDVNALLRQGGGDICAALDVRGARFVVEPCDTEDCEADAGTLIAGELPCFTDTTETVTLAAEVDEAPVVPDGFSVLYVLTEGDSLVIRAVNDSAVFTVDTTGNFTIHTLVYDSTTLDLSIVVIDTTTGFDVNELLIQGGGDICAALDVEGARFQIVSCDSCIASAGSLMVMDIPCFADSTATLTAEVGDAPVVPAGYSIIYVLTSGDSLLIEAVSDSAVFTVDSMGMYTIHTLVYDSTTLDLDSLVVIGRTTGFDVNGLLIQGGGEICGALDVEGATFDLMPCDTCPVSAGMLMVVDSVCLSDSTLTLRAETLVEPEVPAGFSVLYVLTSGDSLVIRAVSDSAVFTVDTAGVYTIHTLVYDSTTLDLGIVVIDTTTGFDVNSLLIQGGGNICGALDVEGARFEVEVCDDCPADAGALSGTDTLCYADTTLTLRAEVIEEPEVPAGFSVLYVLTSGDSLVIRAVSDSAVFTVDTAGVYTIHTLVYDSTTLDLGIVVIDTTTGFDINSLLTQGGGAICAALDVEGARFDVPRCDECRADAGSLEVVGDPCLSNGSVTLRAREVDEPRVPNGFSVLYVLTSGDSLVIRAVSDRPSFVVQDSGIYTIHTLVYDSTTLDLSIVVIDTTTGFDVNELLIQGGGAICAALDVEGARFNIKGCPPVEGCPADPGVLLPHVEGGTGSADCPEVCLDNKAFIVLSARQKEFPTAPEGYKIAFVLTVGDDQRVLAVSNTAVFRVSSVGLYRIHTLVYHPETFDINSIEPGVTTGAGLDSIFVEGGGSICGAFDEAGAWIKVKTCSPCMANAGHITQRYETCLQAGRARLEGAFWDMPMGGYTAFILTSGEDLVIRAVNTRRPDFIVYSEGIYTIHTLVYNPDLLDLSFIKFGETKASELLARLTTGGGGFCGDLDVSGARFDVKRCHGRMVAYPNPAGNSVNIDLPTMEPDSGQTGSSSHVEIVNARGEVVGRRTLDAGAQRHEIPLNGLPGGLYILRIIVNGQVVENITMTKSDE